MRIGIVGTGRIVQEVLPYLRKWGYEPTTLCGTVRSQETTRFLCERYQIGEAYSNYDQMLSEASMDAVYVAVPNMLHFRYAELALLAGKHVILEKPMTAHIWETQTIARLAKEKQLFLFEAVSTLYNPNYHTLRRLLPEIGTVKQVFCVFCKHSRWYNSFLAGETPSVFAPACAGGALMDLNIYNLHWLTGLFGVPKHIHYCANMERKIDTSGIVVMDYVSFKAVSIAAKSFNAPPCYLINGTAGYLMQTTSANYCGEILLCRDGGVEEYFGQQISHRLQPEFSSFLQQMESGNRAECYELLVQSLMVSQLLTTARKDAGIVFPTDEKENNLVYDSIIKEDKT